MSTDGFPKLDRKPRILIVEDEFLIAEELRSILEDLGCDVACQAPTVADALSAAESQTLDAAFVDLLLRGERADAVALRLESRDVPYAFTTGMSVADALGPLKDHPFIISKPYTTDQVTAILGAMLSKPSAGAA